MALTNGYAGGNTVSYEDTENNIAQGMSYLSNLPSDEVKVFSTAAYYNGSAPFRDSYGYKYELIYKDGTYLLISRS